MAGIVNQHISSSDSPTAADGHFIGQAEQFTSQCNMRFCLFNARSLLNKLPELHYLLYNDDNIDCVCVTESWLNVEISDGLLDPRSLYTIIRCDRDISRGGGVCVFIKKHIRVLKVELQCDYFGVELVCFDLAEFSVPYRVFVVYLPPAPHSLVKDGASKPEITRLLVDCIEGNLTRFGPNVILGDFNCPDINWQAMSCCSEPCHNILYDFVMFNGLTQCVTSPTRLSNVLDLVLVSDPLLVSAIEVAPPFSTSDHNAINFEILYSKSSQSSGRFHRKQFLWKLGDYDSLCDFLACYDWNTLFTYNLTVDSLWRAFREVLDNAIDLFVPYKYVCYDNAARSSHKYPRQIRDLITRKRCIWRARKRDPSNETLTVHYKNIAKECKTAIHDFELRMESNVIDAKNSGEFFKYVNRKLGRSHNIGILKDNLGTNVTADEDKANLLNSFFSSVNIHDNNVQPEFPSRVPSGVKLDYVYFSPDALIKACKSIKPKLTPGPDGYPPFLLKQIICSISSPLSAMYQSFMSIGKVPADWKVAFITPLFKKGASSDPANYRPISLTSVFSKLMERLIVTNLLSYLSMHKLISNEQHGFLSRRSTATNLLESLNDWSLNIENGKCQKVAYIDFAKAFDSVCHSKLITKLRMYGIGGCLLQWISDFLTGRSQQTKVGDHLSYVVYIISGVVQGSGLGPVLFLLYINDLPDMFREAVTLKLFADDVKLYSSISSVSMDNPATTEEQLNILARWATDWQLPISYSKCCIFEFGRPNKSLLQTTYLMDSRIIPLVDKVTDLGVTLDKKLKFSSHVSTICCKAHRRANLIIKCFLSKDDSSLISAFKTYVRPILEYCSTVWNPSLVKDINALEVVQRRFTKRIPSIRNLTYYQRLSFLGIDSLELRRLRADLLFMYKLVFGLLNVNVADFSITRISNSRRGHCHKLYLPTCKSNIRYNYFSHRVIRVWNRLPEKTNFQSFNAFRETLTSEILIKFCKVYFM